MDDDGCAYDFAHPCHSQSTITLLVPATGSTARATTEAGEVSTYSQSPNSVWYGWTATVTGTVFLTLDGSTFQTAVDVYVNVDGTLQSATLVRARFVSG